MKCPRCSQVLVSGSRAGVVIDSCSVCHGFWLDPGELERVLAAGSHSDATPRDAADTLASLLRRGWSVTQEGTIACPHCNIGMQKIQFASASGSVIADRCPSCTGMWLDPGELGALFVLFEEKR